MRSQTKKTNSRNRSDAYAANYRNANTSRNTQLGYTAPIVRKLMDRSEVKDYQSRIIKPQLYSSYFKKQGNFSAFTDGGLFTTTVDADRPQCLSIVEEGSDNQGRTGNRITCKSLNVYMNLKGSSTVQAASVMNTINSDGTDTTRNVEGRAAYVGTVRIIIFIDSTPAGSIATAGDLLTGGSVTTSWGRAIASATLISDTSQIQPKSTTRFKILSNETVTLGFTDDAYYKKYIDLTGLSITFTSNVNNYQCVQTNGIYMLVTSNTPQLLAGDVQEYALPKYSYTAKLKFIP